MPVAVLAVIVGIVGVTVIVNEIGAPLQLTPGVIKLPTEIVPLPTGIVAITASVDILITETEPSL